MNKFSISCLLLLCSLAYSCSIEYDGTTKIIFEGRVTNQNGQPLANVPIAIEISDGHDSDISGRDITDANGNYHAVSPGAREKVTYTVRVNYINHNQPADNTYSTSSYYNIIPDYWTTTSLIPALRNCIPARILLASTYSTPSLQAF